MQGIQYVNQKVLVLAPHADDEVIGCGGVIQKYLKNHSSVRVLIGSFVLGSYQKFHKEKGQYEIYDGMIRYKELEQAYKIIGIDDYDFLYVDTTQSKYHSKLETIPRIELASKIEKEIKLFEPTVIYIPSKTKHQDHTALHEAALTATRPYYWNGSIIVYETDGEFSFQPNLYVAISQEEANKKAEALKSFRTQTGLENHPTNPQFLLTKANYRGQSIYSDFAEAFEIVRLHG
ncbi:PIG-L family deacetylase [Alkalihalobacillus macyae]|uniref:PIG-L deacetylase family protein n=1 Tax=Guptibacillus hwajinpoensis TaxID=208199 RepID=UPI00273BE660|nr:PIG-L family deacetylase [Alkalihalobacillus macyae]MDP4552066.1 PIG-L family deacetylase [Alkalihalobacillus macyae]